MTSILYIGMDVHTSNYTLCSYSMAHQQSFGRVQIEPDYKRILQYLEELKKVWGKTRNSSADMRRAAWDILCTIR